MDASPPFCPQKIIYSPLFLEVHRIRPKIWHGQTSTNFLEQQCGWFAGVGRALVTPQKIDMSSEEDSTFQKENFHLSNHWPSKAMIDTLLGTIIAPSQNTSEDDCSFSQDFPRRDVSLTHPHPNPCLVHVTNYWAQSALETTQRNESDLFWCKSPGEKLENPTKTEIPLCKSKFRSEKSVSRNGFRLQEWPIHTVIRLGYGIKFPTPNIIYPEFHANLHSRLLISSISRFSHSFSKYQGKEKACKQFCWSLQIRPSCFWKGVKTLPNDFAGSNRKTWNTLRLPKTWCMVFATVSHVIMLFLQHPTKTNNEPQNWSPWKKV